jgi:hypothetical protein
MKSSRAIKTNLNSRNQLCGRSCTDRAINSIRANANLISDMMDFASMFDCGAQVWIGSKKYRENFHVDAES